MFEKISSTDVPRYRWTKKFQSSKSSTQGTNQSMFKFNHQYRCDVCNVKCQSVIVEVKFKCDDLVNQVSITNSDGALGVMGLIK